MANAAGFKANIKTNEPGIDGKLSPADVNMEAQPPPYELQERYTRSTAFGTGANSKLH